MFRVSHDFLNAIPTLTIEPPPDDSVALWHVDTGLSQDLFDACNAVLSDDERVRAGKFHFEKDRRQFVVARGSLRHLLGSLLNLGPGFIEFDYGVHGKPLLRGTEAPAFNLAHSGTHIFIGVSPNLEIGVDLEVLRPEETRMAPLVRNICTSIEADWVSDLPDREKELALSRLWTAKEAVLKAIGSGFQIPPDEVEITEAVLQGRRGPCSTKMLTRQEDKAIPVFPMPEFEREYGCSAAVAIASREGSVRIDRRGSLWNQG